MLPAFSNPVSKTGMTVVAPTLKELIRLSFAESAVWLNGKSQAGRVVNWVALSFDEAQPGDILLLPAAELSAEMVAKAQRLGLGALLAAGNGQFTPPAPPADLPEDLAVLSVPGEQDLRAIQRLMLTILINQRAALMERGARIQAQLSQLTAEGSGLEGLAQAIGSISGRGVLIQDKRLQILAEQPSPGLMAIWADVAANLAEPDTLPEPLRDRKQAGRQPHVVAQQVPGGLARIVMPIIVGEVARGYLSLIGLNGELDALDYLVAEQGSRMCAVEMARNKAVRETEKRLKGDLLTVLLQEQLAPRDAQLWVQTMGLDLALPHAALRFAWDGPSPPSRRRLETLVNGEVARMGLKTIVNPLGSEVICFCEEPARASRPSRALALGQAVLERELDEYPGARARCGIGTLCDDLSDWGASFRQAGQALDLARRLAEDRPLFFPDLSVYRLLLQMEHNPELIGFQEEILGPLLAYEGGRELIHTLKAYFEHNGNLSQTAEALFIHRNTLIYRMERIAEITGLDLDRPETRLAVQLALHISRMMGTYRE